MIPSFKPFGLGDLIVLKQQLHSYEAGEIAHIENVMGGEERNRSHRRFNQVQTRFLEEIEKEKESVRDLQSTERHEVENEIKREVERQEKFSAGLEVSGGFGPIQVSAYAKYDLDSSVLDSEMTAQKYAKEITEKALERVKERIKEERQSQELSETEETNEHKFKNDTNNHISGIYRWVNKNYLVKPVNYGQRLFYEITLPEPAAFLIFSRLWNLQNRELPAKPVPPSIPVFMYFGREAWFDGSRLRFDDPGLLNPSQISEYNYMKISGLYGAEGFKPPPADTIYASHSISKEFDSSADWILEGESIKIPDQYESVSCQVTIVIKDWEYHDKINKIALTGEERRQRVLRRYPYGLSENKLGFARLHIGQNALQQRHVFFRRLLGNPIGGGNFTTYDLNLNQERGILPISGTGNHIGTIAINLLVTCSRTEESYQEWQLATFRAIMAAYNKRLLEYEEKVTAMKISAGVKISGDNPERNILTVKEELKRLFLKLWMAEDLDLLDAVTDGDATVTPLLYPDIISENVLQNNPKITFAEEAFDWENISFRMLPYFNGRKSKWVELFNYTDPDPVFENFLKAGAAFVRIPVQPSYTHAVLYYQLTGMIWSRYAGLIPALTTVSSDPDAELYNTFLSEVDPEEGETHRLPDGTRIDIHSEVVFNEDDSDTFKIKVPTDLVWLQQTENRLDLL